MVVAHHTQYEDRNNVKIYCIAFETRRVSSYPDIWP